MYARTPEETLIIGTEGYIKIFSPGHCPTQITLTKFEGRSGEAQEVFDFPLPLPTADMRLPTGEVSTCNCDPPYDMFNYPNSIGMSYEAEAVMDCIRSGATESEEYSLAESL